MVSQEEGAEPKGEAFATHALQMDWLDEQRRVSLSYSCALEA
jgi:hypothetical protein